MRSATPVVTNFTAQGVTLHILFVCTGNICRSPTAERLTVLYGDQLEVPNLRVSSAGTRAMIDHPMHPEAAHVLEKLGGDASNFGARQLTTRMASGVDLILTMTRAHRDKVLELAPRALRRTFTLVEAAYLASSDDARCIADLASLRPQLVAPGLIDIADPINQSPDVFHEVGGQIADLLPPIIEFCRRSESTSN